MIRTALKNPHLVVVCALAITVLGAYAYHQIPADLLPQFNTPAVQVVTFYPGMPPEVMEKDIMSRIQRWTGQSVGIEHQEAKAMQGVCIVKDFFNEGISMDTAMAQVTSYAMSDLFYLPPGTIPPMVMPFDPTASVPLCLVVVSNPQMDEQELYDIAYYELRNKLQSIQGVIAPAVYGGKLRRILAYVDREKLEQHGLSLMDVQQALLKQNVLIPAGSIKIGKQDLQIFTNAIPEHVEELNETPIKVVDGQPVLMRHVGEVRNSSQIQTNIVRVNGARQAYIPIYRQPGANTIEIVSQIRELLPGILVRLQTERAEDPKMSTLVLSLQMDQSIGVQSSIRSLQIAALFGAGLAGIVVLVFLRNLRFHIDHYAGHPVGCLGSDLWNVLHWRYRERHDVGWVGVGHRHLGRSVDRGAGECRPTCANGKVASAGGVGGDGRGRYADSRLDDHIRGGLFSGCVSIGPGKVFIHAAGRLRDHRDCGLLRHIDYARTGLLCQVPSYRGNGLRRVGPAWQVRLSLS